MSRATGSAFVGAIIAAVAAGALGAAPAAEAQAGDDASAELWDAIDDWNAAFDTAFERRDVDAITALFTEDAAIVEPMRAAVRGRANIADYFAYYLDVGLDRIESRTEEIFGDGDTAVEIGTSRAYI
jgi:ketosteroid isomerase-like protein